MNIQNMKIILYNFFKIFIKIVALYNLIHIYIIYFKKLKIKISNFYLNMILYMIDYMI